MPRILATASLIAPVYMSFNLAVHREPKRAAVKFTPARDSETRAGSGVAILPMPSYAKEENAIAHTANVSEEKPTPRRRVKTPMLRSSVTIWQQRYEVR